MVAERIFEQRKLCACFRRKSARSRNGKYRANSAYPLGRLDRQRQKRFAQTATNAVYQQRRASGDFGLQGRDFPIVWQEWSKIIIDEQSLLETLTQIVEELEQRKTILRAEDCANIDEYNHNTGNDLRRIIFACDEIAEVLDKTGLDKCNKETVSKIEAKLSVIARQGRAFGIHLILATQRPDATILSGQIRNNLDYRVCGRADNVLSQIILDSTAASEQIPKDAQGRFIMHDGTVFQGYLFDENKMYL